MKKSLKSKIVTIQLLFIFMVAVVSIVLSYHRFRETMQKSTSELAETIAETSSLVIDGDMLHFYKETRQRDSDYYEIWNRLIDYRHTNEDIVDLKVVWFDEAGMHYLLDTDLTPQGAFLGDVSPVNGHQRERMEALVDGGDIEEIIYGDRVECYRSIKSSYNIHMGYVVVGITTQEDQLKQGRFLLQLVCLVGILSIIASVYIIRRFMKVVIGPMNALSDAMINYSKSIEQNTGETSFDKISIHTGDEIENLYNSLRKMESELYQSTSRLAVATWNSNHDSMTQLYNKRYLGEFLKQYTGEVSVAIVYFDIDHLKQMNDVCGHESGDQVIIRTAEFISSYESAGGTSFRVGGDEFLMILFGKTEAEIRTLVEQMKKAPGIVLTDRNSPVQCRISIGYAFSEQATDLEKLMEQADQSMYLDKKSRRT